MPLYSSRDAADIDQQLPPRPALEDSPESSLAHKRALRMLSVALTRQNIGSLASGRSPTLTPLTQPPPPSTHVRPSPLVTHVQAASPFSLSGSTTIAGSAKHRLASPIFVSDLIESKKKKLQTQLAETRRLDVSQLRTTPPSSAGHSSPADAQAKVRVVRDRLSATMVTQLRESRTEPEAALETGPEAGSEATVTQTLQGTQFGFSPPARLVSSPPPPVQSLQREASERTPTHSFVFSPPLTRSSARRLREKSVEVGFESGSTAMATATGARVTAATKQTKRGPRCTRSHHDTMCDVHV